MLDNPFFIGAVAFFAFAIGCALIFWLDNTLITIPTDSPFPTHSLSIKDLATIIGRLFFSHSLYLHYYVPLSSRLYG